MRTGGYIATVLPRSQTDHEPGGPVRRRRRSGRRSRRGAAMESRGGPTASPQFLAERVGGAGHLFLRHRRVDWNGQGGLKRLLAVGIPIQAKVAVEWAKHRSPALHPAAFQSRQQRLERAGWAGRPRQLDDISVEDMRATRRDRWEPETGVTERVMVLGGNGRAPFQEGSELR